jgi:hypothetical protein
MPFGWGVGMRTFLVCAGLSLASVAPAAAGDLGFEDLTEDQQAETIGFVTGNSLHTLFHEAGHMLVSEFALPILGREEDSVDNLATVMLLSDRNEEFDTALVDTADGFWLFDEAQKAATGEDSPDESAYYDEHALNLQRSYQVVCLMVGHDPEGFKEIADTYELPDDRRERCRWEYEQVAASWDKVLEPHLRGDGQEATISIVYDEPAEERLVWAAATVREAQLLERVAQAMVDRYAITDGITFRATTCGVENAFWHPAERTVTFCYELADYYKQLSVKWFTENE